MGEMLRRAVRPAARPQDLRDLRRPLALYRRADRGPVQRRHQICRHLLGRAARLGEQRRAGGRRAGGGRAAEAGRRAGPADPGQLRCWSSRCSPPGWSTSCSCSSSRSCSARGKKLFGEDAKPGEWELIDSRTSTTGVIIARYRPKGPVRTGSFALAEPTEAELARREKMARGGLSMAETATVIVEAADRRAARGGVRRLARPRSGRALAVPHRRAACWSAARSTRASAAASGSTSGAATRSPSISANMSRSSGPRRLAFDFWTSFSEERTRITIEIAPDGDGSALTLTHEGVWADWADKTRQGWTMILDESRPSDEWGQLLATVPVFTSSSGSPRGRSGRRSRRR